MSEKCPKCGSRHDHLAQARANHGGTFYVCGTFVTSGGETSIEGETCLRRQLAQKDRELEQAKAKLEFIAGSLRRGLAKYDIDPTTELWYGHMETCRALAAGQVGLDAVDRRVSVPDPIRPSLREQREMGVED